MPNIDRLTALEDEIESLRAELKEYQHQLAEAHKLWQDSCSDAFETSKQLAQAREALKRIKDLSSDGQEDCHCPASYRTATKALAGKK